jgi:hypothetical protein
LFSAILSYCRLFFVVFSPAFFLSSSLFFRSFHFSFSSCLSFFLFPSSFLILYLVSELPLIFLFLN